MSWKQKQQGETSDRVSLYVRTLDSTLVYILCSCQRQLQDPEALFQYLKRYKNFGMCIYYEFSVGKLRASLES